MVAPLIHVLARCALGAGSPLRSGWPLASAWTASRKHRPAEATTGKVPAVSSEHDTDVNKPSFAGLVPQQRQEHAGMPESTAIRFGEAGQAGILVVCPCAAPAAVDTEMLSQRCCPEECSRFT